MTDTQSSTPAGRFKLHGSKRVGETVGRVILEGSTSNPERWIDLKGEADLTEDELANLKAMGLDVRRVGATEETTDDANQGDAPVEAESRETQQASQAAPVGASKPAASTKPSTKS